MVSISDFVLQTSQVGFKDSSEMKLCWCILAFGLFWKGSWQKSWKYLYRMIWEINCWGCFHPSWQMLSVWGVPAVGVPCYGTENMLLSFLCYTEQPQTHRRGANLGVSQCLLLAGSAQGVVTTPGCSSEHHRVHGTPEWHFCVIHGKTVLSWSPSGAFPLFPYPYWLYVVTCPFSPCCWTISVLLRIHRNPCALPVTTCSVVLTAWGLEHCVPALGGAK